MDTPHLSVDTTQVWQSLREVIAHSSGFQSWCSENGDELVPNSNMESEQSPELDRRISLYLKDTLQTLAY